MSSTEPDMHERRDTATRLSKQWSFNTDAESASTIAKRISDYSSGKDEAHVSKTRTLRSGYNIRERHLASFSFWFDGNEATEEEWRSERRRNQPVSGYLQLSEQYLGFKQPGSVYSFSDVLERCKQEEVASKARYFDKMKSEAENCSLTQGDKLCNEKKWSLRLLFNGCVPSKKATTRRSSRARGRKRAAQEIPLP
ncbi:hypothetical protein DY000_02049051 [Brassica cretica]|uniref:Uncharacterized protein n=1 Tax=Brassica cretica TaxID=69181 RepID=A0ABQ7F093_BRACR|nr:hypothetical protein DY000_02049051 [Brassica cretica]